MVYAGKYRSSNEVRAFNSENASLLKSFQRILMLPYGPMLKKQRAAIHQMLNPKGSLWWSRRHCTLAKSDPLAQLSVPTMISWRVQR